MYAGRPDLATHPHNLFLGLAVFFGIPAALAFAGLVLLALPGGVEGVSDCESDERRLTAVGIPRSYSSPFSSTGFSSTRSGTRR